MTTLKEALDNPDIAMRVLQTALDKLRRKYNISKNEIAMLLVGSYKEVREDFQKEVGMSLDDYITSKGGRKL